MKKRKVTVRWQDGHTEEFEATEARFGRDLLFIQLADGENCQIPSCGVRWFSISQESRQN